MSVSRRRLAASALALAALLATPAGPGASEVLAHAQLVASSPGAGEVLESAPAEIRLVFSEPLERTGTSLDIASEDGTTVVQNGGQIDPADSFALVVSNADLSHGVYTVTWRTLSAADGHSASGFFSFGIGDADVSPTTGSSGHQPPGPADVIGRWLTYAGLLLAVGAAAFTTVVLRTPLSPIAIRVVAAGLAAASAASLALAVDAGSATGAPLDYLLATRNGLLQLARSAVALIGAGAILLVPPRATAPIAMIAGLVGIGLHVAAGHAAALPGPVPVAAQVAHVAAVGIWVGGLVMLAAFVVRPGLLMAGARPPLIEIVPRFSALALVAIAMLAATGTYAAWVQTGSLVSTDTEYGRTLIVKTVVFLAAAALGLLNYLDGGRLRQWVAAFRTRLTLEVAGAAGVLLVTAFLAATPPAGAARGIQIQPQPNAFGVVAPGMSMLVTPGRPGVNRIVVRTTDALAVLPGMELALDRVDTGSSTRVPLVLSQAGGGHGHGGMTSDSVEWNADALVLPPDSTWETSVRLLSEDGGVVGSQRFAFVMTGTGIGSGRATSLLTPAVIVGMMLLLAGAVALGLGFGGWRLPRTDAAASRIALSIGAIAAVTLGIAIGVEHIASL